MLCTSCAPFIVTADVDKLQEEAKTGDWQACRLIINQNPTLDWVASLLAALQVLFMKVLFFSEYPSH